MHRTPYTLFFLQIFAASAALTTANLSCLYGTAVDVRELDGRQVVLWN